MNNNLPGKASIVILTHNNLEYTRQCLESIYAKTEYSEYEIVIVDNASDDGTHEYLEEIKSEKDNIQIIHNKQNVGFAKGNNQGVKASKGEYLVFLNNDTVVTYGWLTRLVEYLQDPYVGMVGPVTNSASNEAKISVTYETIDDLDLFAEEYTLAHHGETFEIRALAFYCVALRRDILHQIGPLDERFRLGMFEDDDYAERIRDFGYKVICTEDVFIHHWGGASFLELDRYEYLLLFRENRKKFENKWNTTWQPHLQRQELLPEQAIQLSEAVYRLQDELLAEAKIEETDESFEIIANRLIEQERAIEWKDKEIERLSWTLDEIHKSNAWKIVQIMWNARRYLVPENSQQEEILAKFTGKTQPSPNRVYANQKPIDNDQSLVSSSPELKKNHVVSLTENHIAILAPQFFDLDGQSTFIGGAERYLLELVNLIREFNYEPVVFQSAHGEWEQVHQGTTFFGLDSGGDNQRLNVLFHNLIGEDTPVIYLVFNLAAPSYNKHSIGISHGVFWDHKEYEFPEDRMNNVEYLLASISNLSRIVSVDTNTINWIRTVQPSLATKSVYIPNFVDTETFRYSDKSERSKLVVLYPRRLYTARGFWLVKEIIPEFLENYPELEFHFIGQADPDEEAAVKQLVNDYQKNVFWKTLEMQDMHEAYEQADITLIPTVYSEGTSLSCLEAMAAGSAVLATNIGGLTDLVIHGFNGLLVEPSVPALRDALSLLCDNPELRNRLGKNAREVASAFTLNSWQDRWRKVLREEFFS